MLLAGVLLGVDSLSADDTKKGATDTAFKIRNEDGKLLSLAAKDWNKLPRQQVQLKESAGNTTRYEGVSLVEVLRFAGVPFDKHLRGPRVATYILIEAADGYRAVFALAEVDPSMTDHIVLVADRRDGKPLAESAGPYRLIVPGDKLHSRWV
ncbi:MAG TPA: molybdopterin-dependent oxidoreductase, partial [Gemmataceae bacterium]|nr:molybdopterin-dependent oxidoreductase [Gemmataceae bacterium]